MPAQHPPSDRGPTTPPKGEFAREAATKPTGIVREFFDFLRFNKKWWLIPLVVVLLLIGVALFAGGGAAAPFIYTLF